MVFVDNSYFLGDPHFTLICSFVFIGLTLPLDLKLLKSGVILINFYTFCFYYSAWYIHYTQYLFIEWITDWSFSCVPESRILNCLLVILAECPIANLNIICSKQNQLTFDSLTQILCHYAVCSINSISEVSLKLVPLVYSLTPLLPTSFPVNFSTFAQFFPTFPPCYHN